MVRLVAVTAIVVLCTGAPTVAAAPLVRADISPGANAELVQQRGFQGTKRPLQAHRPPGKPRILVVPHRHRAPMPRGDYLMVPPIRDGVPTFRF
jgi:hypothetical protein